MGKIKYNKRITEDDIQKILNNKYRGLICPSCKKDGIFAGCIETKYDEDNDKEIVLSFDVFCRYCGDVHGKWENTNREYFFCKK